MKYFTNLLLSACAMALLSGCNEKDDDPTGPSLSGNLYGFINAVDEYGNVAAKNGITVTLDGITPTITATTNADGRYEFTNLPSGTYNVLYNRADIATFRRISIPHVGGNQPTFLGTSTISATSTTTLGTVSTDANTFSGSVIVSVPYSNTTAPIGYNNRLAVYVSATPNVNSNNGTLIAYIVNSSNIKAGIGSASLSKSALNNAGFASGTSLYLVVYGTPSILNGYADPATGKIFYHGLSALSSNQVSFIVP